MLNSKHLLVKLADVLDWEEIERSYGAHFDSSTGHPALPTRLGAGLLYFQHAYDCSDEAIVNMWVDNPLMCNISPMRRIARQKRRWIRRA
jgi:IS5 family transposase